MNIVKKIIEFIGRLIESTGRFFRKKREVPEQLEQKEETEQKEENKSKDKPPFPFFSLNSFL